MRKLALLIALGGCQQTAVTPSAQLAGIRDMVRVEFGDGGYIFATSSERDELRVLQLVTTDNTQPRRYVRAPNPIQPLAIPVLRRPATLATDTYYKPSAGMGDAPADVSGPYVYATSSGAPQISIVWANPDDKAMGLTELARLQTIAPVTAISAQGSVPVGTSTPFSARAGRLYFATFDGTNGTLFRLQMPQPGDLIAIHRDDRATSLQAMVVNVLTRPGESFGDVVALPGNRIAVVMRGEAVGAQNALVLDGDTGALVHPLEFPARVRALYTHGEITLRDGLGPTPPGTKLAPGSRVFGVLDESACGSASCGGLVAVDTATGKRSSSAAGRLLASATDEQRIAPVLTFGGGLIQSVSIVPDGRMAMPQSYFTVPVGYVPTTLAAIGIVTLNGQMGFFLAGELVQIDVSRTPTVQIDLPDGGVAVTNGVRDGGFDLNASVAAGATRDDVIFVVGHGAIPGVAHLQSTGDRVPTPYASRAQVGDWVDRDEAGDAGCSTSRVTAIETDAVRFAPACDGVLSVRAYGPSPYVVTSATIDYIGRFAPGERYIEAVRSYSQHYVIFDDTDPNALVLRGAYDPTAVPLGFDMPGPLEDGEQRYVLSIDDGYLPTVLALTPTACTAGSTTLPGAVLHDPIRQRVFVAYPSANGIVEIDPSYIRRTAALDGTGLLCWR